MGMRVDCPWKAGAVMDGAAAAMRKGRIQGTSQSTFKGLDTGRSHCVRSLCWQHASTVSEGRGQPSELVGGSGSGVSQVVPRADAPEAVVAHCSSVFRTPCLPSPPSFLPSFLSFLKKFTKAFHVFTHTDRNKHWCLTPTVNCFANNEPIYNSRAIFSFICQC